MKKEQAWEEGVQRVRHGVDRPMLVIILVLLCLGTIMVFSASYPNALASKNDSLYYIRHQLLWLALGGVFSRVSWTFGVGAGYGYCPRRCAALDSDRRVFHSAVRSGKNIPDDDACLVY